MDPRGVPDPLSLSRPSGSETGRTVGSAHREGDGLLAVQLGGAPAIPGDDAAVRVIRLAQRIELLRRRRGDAPGQAGAPPDAEGARGPTHTPGAVGRPPRPGRSPARRRGRPWATHPAGGAGRAGTSPLSTCRYPAPPTAG